MTLLFAFSVLVPAAAEPATPPGGDFGSFEEVIQHFDGKNVVVTARIYGLGPTHEVTGSFRGGKRYFNADGVFSASGQVRCPGFRYEVRSRRGVSSIVVTLPRTCVERDAGRGLRMQLLMLDPHEPGRGVYLRIDSARVATIAGCRPPHCKS